MPRRALILLGALVVVGLAVFLTASDWLTLEWLKSHRDDLVAFCQANMVMTVAAFCAAFVAWAALCLPGVGLFALAGGMLFGHVLGTFLATLSATLGATLAFLTARHLLHDWAHARFGRMFRIIDRGLERDGAFYVFMSRLIIVMPFFLINPVMGLTDIRLRTFILASILGMVGNSFMWVNAGTMLNRIERIEDVLSAPVIASFTLVGVLPLVLKWLFFRGK